MNLKLTELEIRMLLKCLEKPRSKKDVTQILRKFSKHERDLVINNLVTKQLIITEKMPKPNTRKTPVFYKITDKGKIWVEDYLDNYPKG